MGSFTKHKLCPICWWDAVLLLSLKWLVLSTLGDGTPGDGEPFPLVLTRWEPDRWCYEAGPNEDYTLSTGSVFILLGRSWASAGARAPTPPPPWHSTRLGCGNSSCPRVQTEFLRVLTRTKIKGGWEDQARNIPSSSSLWSNQGEQLCGGALWGQDTQLWGSITDGGWDFSQFNDAQSEQSNLFIFVGHPKHVYRWWGWGTHSRLYTQIQILKSIFSCWR